MFPTSLLATLKSYLCSANTNFRTAGTSVFAAVLFCSTISGCRPEKEPESATAPAVSSTREAPRVLLYLAHRTPCQRSDLPGASLEPLRVHFVGPVLPLGTQPATSDISIQPAVAGTWKWTATNELSFFPDADWVQGRYRVQLSDDIVPAQFALATQEVVFSPSGACIATSHIHKPYRITAPKLPSRPTDTLADQLMITFDQAIGKKSTLQQSLPKAGEITPNIAGEWRWATEQVLSFQPTEPWKAGTSYSVTLAAEIFEPQAIVPGYTYTFATPQSTVEAARNSSYVTAPSVPNFENNFQPEPALIRFSSPVAASELINKPLTKGISLSPPIQGEWKWTADNLLRFTPSVHWMTGTRYTAQLTAEAFGETKPGATYTEQFTTPSMSWSFTRKEFYIDPRNPQNKHVALTLAGSYPLSRSELERKVSLTLEARGEKAFPNGQSRIPYGFSLTYSEDGREAYILSDPIQLPEVDASMKVAVALGVPSSIDVSGSYGRIEDMVFVPAVSNYFRIEGVTATSVSGARQKVDQVLILSATTGISEAASKHVRAYLLPVQHPTANQAAEKFHWDDPALIEGDVLAKSTPLTLEALPSAEEFSKTLSFKVQSETERYVYIEVSPDFVSSDGYRLGSPFKQIAYLGTLPPTVKILTNGSLLSLTGEKKVSLMARDVAAMHIEIARLLPKTVNHLVTQMGGSFAVPNFENYQFTADDIAERFTEIREFPARVPGQANYSSIDLGQYLNKSAATQRGVFLLTVRENRQGVDDSPHEYGIHDRRLILVTDFGIVVKDNQDGTKEAFVQSISSGQPVAGATVSILSKNGLSLINRTTGTDGHVSFPNVANFTREKEAVVYTVEKQGDFSFLPLRRGDRRLNVSRFEIGGLTTQTDAPGLQAYLFSNRGVYRPGDEAIIGVVVKSDSWDQNVAGIPFELVITDPRGQEVRKEKFQFDAVGFNEYFFPTQETSPTGRYEVGLYVVKDGRRSSLLGSATIRVEEFLPDRMTIQSEFSTPASQGWIRPEDLSATVSLRTLFGTAATERRVAATMTLSPVFPQFGKYPDHVFTDPLRNNETQEYEEELADGETNEEGKASFSLDLSRFDSASYRLTFSAQGYEAEGGRYVATQAAQTVSPLPYMLGVNRRGDLSYLRSGMERSVQVIAVNPLLDQVEVAGLTAKLLELRWVSVLVKQPNGTYSYQSMEKEKLVSEQPATIPAAGLEYALPTETAGQFALAFVDEKGVERSRIVFNVAGEGELSTNLEKNAELEVVLNKPQYAVGEEIELQIKAPYTGAGLISIEKEKVYSYQWFTSSSTSSVQRIKVPQGLEGNGYVQVSFVRALDSKEIFLSPLSYAVVPFSIDRKPRTTTLKLDAPELVKPGQDIAITLTADKPSRAAVFLVDEGILQVARFTTPNPLDHFYRKRALEVETSQILDLLIAEYSLQQALSAAGGDQDSLARHLNPFKRRRDKPVVEWFGLVDVDTSPKAFSYTVPDYFNGTVRVMAVTVSEGSIGSIERKVTVRGDFVISPNVPSAVSPGDVFEVSTSVYNNVVGTGEGASVAIRLETGTGLEVLGEQTVQLPVPEGREKSVVFRIRAKDELGSQGMTFHASHGQTTAALRTDTSVRPPSPLRTTLQAGATAGGSAEIPIVKPAMYEFGSSSTGSVSKLPLGFAQGLLKYLESYPYGCTEQLTSKAVPALILRSNPGLGSESQEHIKLNLKTALQTLAARQNSDGSFGMWYPGSYSSNEIDVYVGFFLLEAKERGYPVPMNLLNDSLRRLRAIANLTPENIDDARTAAFASYVLTRSGVVTTAYLTSIRGWLDNYEANRPTLRPGVQFESWKKDIVASFLAATYSLLQVDNQALELSKGVSFIAPVTPRYDYYHDAFVHSSLYLYLSAKHFPSRLEGISPAVMLNYLQPIIDGGYNSLSSSYALFALDAYMQRAKADQGAQLDVTQLFAGGNSEPITLPQGSLYPTFTIAPDATAIRLVSPDYLYYQLYHEGYDTQTPTQAIKNGIEVHREFLDDDGNVVTESKLGEKVTVVIRARALGEASISNAVIVDMLPGGVEVEMSPRRFGSDAEDSADAPLFGFGNATSSFVPEYADVREDRVLLFGTIPNDQTVEFRYRLSTTNKGTFIVPPIYGESMYDRSLTATFPGGSLEIKANE